MGLSAKPLLHSIQRDQMIRFADVERPAGRLADRLWRNRPPGASGDDVSRLPAPSAAHSGFACAHADDPEIGCGGTVLHLLGCGTPVEVRWAVLSALRNGIVAGTGRALPRGAAASELMAELSRRYFPYETALKDFFEEPRAGPDPDLILTHHRGDGTRTTTVAERHGTPGGATDFEYEI
jgi:hypothetical protein